jgi:hypothetical protein
MARRGRHPHFNQTREIMKTYHALGGLLAAIICQGGHLAAQPAAGRIVHWGTYVG